MNWTGPRNWNKTDCLYYGVHGTLNERRKDKKNNNP